MFDTGVCIQSNPMFDSGAYTQSIDVRIREIYIFIGPDDVITHVTSSQGTPLHPSSLHSPLSHLASPYTIVYLYMRYTHFRGPDDVITYVTSPLDTPPLQPQYLSSTLSHLDPPYTFMYLYTKYSLFRGPDDVITHVTSSPDTPPSPPIPPSQPFTPCPPIHLDVYTEDVYI